MNHSFCSIYGSPISDAQHPLIVPSWLLRISTTFALLPTRSSSFISCNSNDGMITISFINILLMVFDWGKMALHISTSTSLHCSLPVALSLKLKRYTCLASQKSGRKVCQFSGLFLLVHHVHIRTTFSTLPIPWLHFHAPLNRCQVFLIFAPV